MTRTGEETWECPVPTIEEGEFLSPSLQGNGAEDGGTISIIPIHLLDDSAARPAPASGRVGPVSRGEGLYPSIGRRYG